MHCQQCQDLLDSYRRNALPADLRARMERHFADCAACREALAEAEQLGRLLRLGGEAPPPPAPEYFARLPKRVLERLAQGSSGTSEGSEAKIVELRAVEPEPERSPRKALPRWALAAAVLAVGILSGILLVEGSHLQTRMGKSVAMRRSVQRSLASGVEAYRADQPAPPAAPVASERVPAAPTVVSEQTPAPGEFQQPLAKEQRALRQAGSGEERMREASKADAALPKQATVESKAADKKEILERRIAVARGAKPQTHESRDSALGNPYQAQPGERTGYSLAPRLAPAGAAPPPRKAKQHAFGVAEAKGEPAGPALAPAGSPRLALQPRNEAPPGAERLEALTTASASQSYYDAEDARLRGAYSEALALYERVVKEVGASALGAQAQLRIGDIAYEQLRDMPRARSAYEACLQAPLRDFLAPNTLQAVRSRLETINAQPPAR